MIWRGDSNSQLGRGLRDEVVAELTRTELKEATAGETDADRSRRPVPTETKTSVILDRREKRALRVGQECRGEGTDLGLRRFVMSAPRRVAIGTQTKRG